MSRIPALSFILLLVLVSGCGSCDDTIDKNSTDTNNGTTGANNTNNGTTGTNNTNNTNNGTTGTNNGTTGTNNGTTGRRSIDLLMVIDNSGSMCGIQATMRDNVRQMLAELTGADLDVRIGVTTTHLDNEYVLEPVARAGELQSTPQPVPGFVPSCHTAQDAEGDPIPGDFTPLREALDAALACSAADPGDYQFSDADIECAMYSTPANCSIAGVCEARECRPESLFPPPDSYVELPPVLEVREYVDETGKLDFDSLVADFRCMSFVGTRGHGIEQGLKAAVIAVSPDKTGGAVEDPVDASAPNHGLLRGESDFALLFVTDENDCSHDGSLDTQSICGGDVCEFANAADAVDSPLVEPSVWAEDLVENLRLSKGDPEFDSTRVRVASIHGKWQRWSGTAQTEQQCSAPDYQAVEPSCTFDVEGTIAFSGDRYERFLDAFGSAGTYPLPGSGDDGHRLGAVCESDLGQQFLDATAVLGR